MKKIFKLENITWKLLILLSLIMGIIPGVINRIPFFIDSSFADIAVVFDIWILLAIFIIMNCKNPKEAMIKCFVFFLISQPLIYITEAAIDTIFYKKDLISILIMYFKNYYFGSGWFYWTILVLPGSFIAWMIKKQNILSSLILSVATGYYAFTGMYNLFMHYHILSCIFCLIMAYLLTFVILKNKKERIICIIITTIMLLIGLFSYYKTVSTPIIANYLLDIPTETKIKKVEIKDEAIATYSIEDDNTLSINTSKKVGKTILIVIDEDDNKYEFKIESNYKGIIAE